MDMYIEQRGWESIRSSYYDDLKQACKNVGEKYSGSHAFRVNYVKDRYEELIEKGYSDKEALQRIEHELGHSRIEMSEHYRRG